jgi:prepilin-type N-terminal cleavage/methylation domain-containing protein
VVEHGIVMLNLKRQDGFTITEMLMAMLIAVIVSLAAFSLIEVVMKRSGETAARVETTQRARGALDTITRELRSQVCVIRSDPSVMTSARSIFSATATSVVFFADTADESFKSATDTIPVPTLRTLTFTAGTKATGTITETIRPGVEDASVPGVDAVRFSSSTGEATRTLLTNIEQFPDPLDGTKLVPVFRYFTYDLTKSPPTPTKELLPGSGALSTADVASIAKITITYRVRGAGKVTQTPSTPLIGEVFTRTVDPNTTTPKPTCL